MTLLLTAGAVILVALAAYFAVRLFRTPVPVATQAEIEARQLDEGMIVGDPLPIGSADDVGVVTVVPTDASPFIGADDFDGSTGPVEPAPPRGPARATDTAAAAGSPGAGSAANTTTNPSVARAAGSSPHGLQSARQWR